MLKEGMKFNAPLAALILIAAVSLTGCKTGKVGGVNSPQGVSKTNPSAEGERARRVSSGELRASLEKGEAFVLDVRSEPEFKEGHIKGAHLLPRRELSARLNELPKDKLIVTYCACPFDHLSIEAALDIKHGGYENVAALTGGLNAWSKEGLPTETAEAAPAK